MAEVAQVSVPQVIHKEDDHVGPLLQGRAGGQQEEEERQERSHPGREERSHPGREERSNPGPTLQEK